MCFLFVGSFVGCLVSSKEMCFPPKEYQDYNKKNVNVLFKKSFISSGVGYSFVNQITTTVYK